MANLTRYDLDPYWVEGYDPKIVEVKEGRFIKFSDVEALLPKSSDIPMQATTQTCQIIVEDLLSFMGSADMLVGCNSERRVQIRDKLLSIVAGKLLHG